MVKSPPDLDINSGKMLSEAESNEEPLVMHSDIIPFAEMRQELEGSEKVQRFEEIAAENCGLINQLATARQQVRSLRLISNVPR